MNLTQRITASSDFFYKKKDLPTIIVGDKVKVLNYLELPTDDSVKSKDKKKKKERLQLYEGVVISRHEKKNNSKLNYYSSKNVSRRWN